MKSQFSVQLNSIEFHLKLQQIRVVYLVPLFRVLLAGARNADTVRLQGQMNGRQSQQLRLVFDDRLAVVKILQ